MTYANVHPAAAPALDRLALAGVLALLVGACCLTGCVNAAVHDTATKLHAQIQALHETSEPPIASTPEQVAVWHHAWSQALTSTARLIEVSR